MGIGCAFKCNLKPQIKPTIIFFIFNHQDRVDDILMPKYTSQVFCVIGISFNPETHAYESVWTLTYVSTKMTYHDEKVYINVAIHLTQICESPHPQTRPKF
jgi:hypothetical protein